MTPESTHRNSCAAEPNDEVVRAQLLANGVHETLEQRVSGGATVGVVDGLQRHDVDVDDDERAVHPAGPFDLDLESVHARAVVAGAGEGVGLGAREMRQQHVAVRPALRAVTTCLLAIASRLLAIGRGPGATVRGRGRSATTRLRSFSADSAPIVVASRAASSRSRSAAALSRARAARSRAWATASRAAAASTRSWALWSRRIVLRARISRVTRWTSGSPPWV